MQKLIALLTTVFSLVLDMKGKNTDLAKQVNDLTDQNVALQKTNAELLANNAQDEADTAAAKKAANDAATAEKAAEDNSAALQKELDDLHSQVDQVTTDVQTHLNDLAPAEVAAAGGGGSPAPAAPDAPAPDAPPAATNGQN